MKSFITLGPGLSDFENTIDPDQLAQIENTCLELECCRLTVKIVEECST